MRMPLSPSWLATSKYKKKSYNLNKTICKFFIRPYKSRLNLLDSINRMDFWLIAYIIITISVGAGLVSWLYKRGQTMGSMLLLVLLILVFTFYGMRWFEGGNLKGSTVGPNAKWPPIVNMCPDFMVQWKDSTTNRVYCYDAGNIYNLKTANGAGLITGLTINNVPSQSAYLIFNPSGNPGATDLRSDTNGARWPFLYLLRTNPSVVLGDTNGKYLRWEGVINGQQITPENAPLPA